MQTKGKGTMKSIFKYILIALLPLLFWTGCKRESNPSPEAADIQTASPFLGSRDASQRAHVLYTSILGVVSTPSSQSSSGVPSCRRSARGGLCSFRRAEACSSM